MSKRNKQNKRQIVDRYSRENVVNWVYLCYSIHLERKQTVAAKEAFEYGEKLETCSANEFNQMCDDLLNRIGANDSATFEAHCQYWAEQYKALNTYSPKQSHDYLLSVK